MEVTLAALVIICIVVCERRKYRKQLRQKHARCRRLTYNSNPAAQKSGVISFRELAERAALLRSGCRGD
jgi:hypothetical protein